MTPDADPGPLAATQGDETAVPASTSVRDGSGAQNGAEGRVDTVRGIGYSYATRDDVRAAGWSMVTRRAEFSKCSLAELIEWSRLNGQEPSDVQVSGGHLSYSVSETSSERDKRLASMAAADARANKWERETYERLRAKFHPDEATS